MKNNRGGYFGCLSERYVTETLKHSMNRLHKLETQTELSKQLFITTRRHGTLLLLLYLQLIMHYADLANAYNMVGLRVD